MVHVERRLLVPLALLVAASVLWAQETKKPECKCAPREVGASGSRKDWDGYTKGIRWHYDVKEAQEIAQSEGKLVFWYHVAGDLDKEGC